MAHIGQQQMINATCKDIFVYVTIYLFYSNIVKPLYGFLYFFAVSYYAFPVLQDKTNQIFYSHETLLLSEIELKNLMHNTIIISIRASSICGNV